MSDQINLGEISQDVRFALQKVILIDSYTEGRITEVPLEGGTAIVSPNGRGKTTLLQLIPAFYGERTDRIVKPVSNKVNFVRFYLPRSTSYIVFEYLRDGARCCAILCADSSGDGVEYRFVRSSYQQEWFVHDDKCTLVASTNLLERLKQHGVTCTRKMPLDQYRAIIQGKRAHGSDLKQHRSDIINYAFCPSNQSLPHIERIVFGMFMRKANFIDLQRMIVSTVTEASGHISLGAERKKIEAWPDSYESYAAVMAEAHRIDIIQQSYDTVFAAEQELRNIHGRFVSLDRMLEDGQQQAQREHDTAKQGLETAEQGHGVIHRAINDKIHNSDRTIEDLLTKLERLHERHTYYQNQCIEAKADLFDREDEIVITKAQLESRKAALLNQLSNIEDEYRKILDHLSLEHQKRLVELGHQRAEAKDEHQSRVDTIQTEYKQQEDNVRQAASILEKELQEVVECAREEVARTKFQFDNPQPDAALAEIAEQQESKIGEARAKHQAAIEHENEARKDYEKVRDVFAQVEKLLRSLQDEALQAEKKLKSLLMHATPDESSVLCLLRSGRPDWTQDIAKVLREDILTRTDLSPIIGAIQDSIYGLQLNLDHLDTPLVADESALQDVIVTTREALRSIKDRIAQQEAALVQCGANRAVAEDTVSRKSAETAIARSALSSEEQQLKSIRTDLQHSRDAAKEQARHAHREAMRLVEEAKQRLSDQGARRDQDITALRARQEQRKTDSLSIRDQLLGNIQSREADSQKQFNETHQQIDAERTAKLTEHGVDTSALSDLERQISATTKQLNTIHVSRNLVVDWRRWVSAEWSQKAIHEDALSAARKEKAGHEEDRTVCIKTWHEDVNRRKKIISELLQKQDAIRTQRNQVAQHRKALELYPTNMDALPAYNAAWQIRTFVEQTATQFRTLKIHEGRLQQEVSDLKRAFTTNRNSPPDHFYETQRQIIGPDRAPNAREWVPAFKSWYSNEHLHYRNLLRVDARTIAETVGDFRDRMDTFHRKVQHFNRELQDSLNSNQGFRSISGLTVEIVSSIRELEYWNTVEKVAESRREWMGGDLTDLPPPEFASALRELLSHWQLKEGIQAELTSLVRIQGEVIENNTRRPFKKAEDLENISSNGLSYIVMVLIFVAFINRVRGKAPVNIVWALDEIGALDTGNIVLLVDILSRNNITLVTACPDPKPDVLALFRNRRSISRDRRVYDPSTVSAKHIPVIDDEETEVDHV